MGLLDRAKKLAQQAKDLAGDAIDRTTSPQPSPGGYEQPPGAPPTAAPPPGAAASAPVVFGTPAGPVGESWKRLGLLDPAGVLKATERDRAGVPKSTKSEVVMEPYGVGRRWSAGGRAIGFFWLIDNAAPPPDAAATAMQWAALRGPEGVDVPGVGDRAYIRDAGGGRRGVFVRAAGKGFMVEVTGLPDEAAVDLAKAAAAEAASL
jgi:hypothetical protein